MIALALSEDSISKRAQRDAIIESLAQLPDNTRKVRHCCPKLSALLSGQPCVKVYDASRPHACGMDLADTHACLQFVKG